MEDRVSRVKGLGSGVWSLVRGPEQSIGCIPAKPSRKVLSLFRLGFGGAGSSLYFHMVPRGFHGYLSTWATPSDDEDPAVLIEIRIHPWCRVQSLGFRVYIPSLPKCGNGVYMGN